MPLNSLCLVTKRNWQMINVLKVLWESSTCRYFRIKKQQKITLKMRLQKYSGQNIDQSILAS